MNSLKNKFQPRTKNYAAARLGAIAVALLASGCASLVQPGPKYEPPSLEPKNGNTLWTANLPTATDNSVRDLKTWWASFNDAALSALLEAAQTNNPTLAAATARIDQARANLKLAGVSSQPVIGVNTSLNRSGSAGKPIVTNASLGVDAGWEIDLFGAVKRGQASANARLQSSQADWHDARVTLAADVAQNYLNLRACQLSSTLLAQDVTSQTKTLELTNLKVSAGFSAPADATLLRASLANARNQLTANVFDCAVWINSISYLTGLSVDAINEQTKASVGVIPKPAQFIVEQIPASVLKQRPDIQSAERQLAAASEDIGVAIAEQYPKLSLNGNIGLGATRLLGINSNGLNWGFGPSLTLPIFDGGRVAAGIDSSKARYAEQQALTGLKIFGAVREVQEALLRLDSANQREANAVKASSDFEAFFKAAQTRWNVGVGSLLELEEARRLAVNAKSALIQLERERVAQWINLYKAVGGGWSSNESVGSAK
jgi:outer membrane protein, multidrug efflux system